MVVCFINNTLKSQSRPPYCQQNNKLCMRNSYLEHGQPLKYKATVYENVIKESKFLIKKFLIKLMCNKP